ncbi:GYD domain-containing protein [Alsobacter sp. SYSU BS001988]
MPTFIVQGRYSINAVSGMMSEPEDRSRAVGKLLEAVGGKLLSYYVTFGEFDWLLVCDAPNVQAISAATIAAASGGGVTDIKTTVAMSPTEAMEAFRQAGVVASSFKSAGRAEG